MWFLLERGECVGRWGGVDVSEVGEDAASRFHPRCCYFWATASGSNDCHLICLCHVQIDKSDKRGLVPKGKMYKQFAPSASAYPCPASCTTTDSLR